MNRRHISLITFYIDSHRGAINRLADDEVLDEHANHHQQHLVPATVELILLNNRWQRRIRDEKEQKRKAFMMVGMENEYIEQNDAIENQPDGNMDNGLPSVLLNDGESLDFESILSVAKVTVPVENTPEHIVEQFTLNKNQKAVFMIITGDLDGLDRLNEGTDIHSSSVSFSI